MTRARIHQEYGMDAFINMRFFLILVIHCFAAIVSEQCNYTQTCSNCGVSETEATATRCQQYLNNTEESQQYLNNTDESQQYINNTDESQPYLNHTVESQDDLNNTDDSQQYLNHTVESQQYLNNTDESQTYLNYTVEQCLDFGSSFENSSVMVYSADFNCTEFYCNRSLVYDYGSKAARQVCNASCLDIEFIKLPGMKVNVTDAIVTNTTFYSVNMSSPEQCMMHGQSQNNNSILSYNNHTGECLVFMNSYLLEMEDDADYLTYEWNCKTSNCPLLPNPANGSISYRLPGKNNGNKKEKATYTCNSGFVPSSNETSRNCILPNNKKVFRWTEPAISCVLPEPTTTTTQRPKAPQLYIMPCICNPNKQWTNLSNEQIIDMLISELTIDASETTSARAKLNCRQDSRASSKAIGTIAVGIMSVIFGLVICSDLITIWRYCGRIRKRFKRVYRPSNKVGVAQDETTIQSSLSL